MSVARGSRSSEASSTRPRRRSARAGTGLALIDAPWRHELFDKDSVPGCFICRAIHDNPRNDPHNLLLVRGDRAVIVLNRYPYTMGALMVSPIAHLGDLRDIPEETLLDIIRLTKYGMSILDQAIHPKGYNIGVNQGAEAGAGVSDHLHLHLVPRWVADTNFMTTTAGSRVLAEDVDGMYRRLRRAKNMLDKSGER